MKYVVLAAWLAGCGEPSAVSAPVQNTAPAVLAAALPSDAALGELGIAPSAKRDQGSWLPSGPGPFMVEAALREGKGPPPTWIAIDTAGTEARLTYGDTTKVPYGCDGNQMTVSQLSGDGSKLKPGLLWLRPVESAAMAPKSVAIVNGARVTAARRDLTIGPVVVELVRTDPKLGVANFAWRGKRVHQMKIERHDMDGADNAVPMDFVEGGVAVPVAEAAWTIGDDAVVIVLRVAGYEGTSFKTVVVNGETGRVVETMGMYLYQCAF